MTAKPCSSDLDLDLDLAARSIPPHRSRVVADYRKRPDEMRAAATVLGCRLAVPHIPGRGWEWDGDLTAILVTNNSTETAWWQDTAWHATAVCCPLGRLIWKSTLQGQTVLYFGPDLSGFRREFRPFGAVMYSALVRPVA